MKGKIFKRGDYWYEADYHEGAFVSLRRIEGGERPLPGTFFGGSIPATCRKGSVFLNNKLLEEWTDPLLKKVSTTVYLTKGQVQGLKELSFSTGVPASEYIRRGVEAVLQENELGSV